MSNILSVFTPPPSRPLSSSETENCVPCTAVQAAVCVAGGAYFALGWAFRDFKTGQIDAHKHPVWWQKSVRGAGVILVGLGAFRAGEVVQMVLRNRRLVE